MAGGRSAGLRRAGAGAVLVGVAGLGAGCGTGAPSSTSAWQGSTDRTLGAAISGLGVARVVVEREARDDLPHTYAVVSLTDAIETTSQEIGGYSVAQPPDRLHRANQAVVLALQDASALLVEIRVAVASPGLTRSSAQALVGRIDELRDRLDRLDSSVRRAPGSVGRR